MIAGAVKLSTSGGSSSGASFPLTHWGFTAASGDPIGWMGTSTVANNQQFYARLWVPAATTITNLYAAVTTAGTHDGVTAGNRLGLYDDTGAQLGLTASDNALWTAVGWRGGPIAGGPIAAAGAGRWVYAGLLVTGMTVIPAVPFPTGPQDYPFQYAGPGTTRRRAFYLNAGAFPASINPDLGGTGTPTGYCPLFGLN